MVMFRLVGLLPYKMKYPARFAIAEPSPFRLGGSHDNVAVPIPRDDGLG
jgi:hypothetical protein